MSDNYQSVTEEPVETEADETSLDSGNRKLALVAGGVVLLLGAVLAFGPKANRERIANGQMPNFELMGASVVGSRAAAEEAPAAAPATATEAAAAPATRTTATATRAAGAAGSAAAAPATASATEAAASAAEPAATAPEPAAPAAPAAEEAPRTATLSGRILDENGRPLAGATVFVKGANKFASTDQNGNYTVETPAGETNVVYGYGGYQDQEMRVRSGQANNVTLLPSEAVKRKRR